MPKLLPVVDLTSLNKEFLQNDEICIKIGSLEWYDYLETHKSFSVRVYGIRFTAVKKRSLNGFSYWNLKGWTGSNSYHTYLGKSEQLTFEKLTEAGFKMFRCCKLLRNYTQPEN